MGESNVNVSDLIRRFLQFFKFSVLRNSLVDHVEESALSSLSMLLEDETSPAIFISALTLSEKKRVSLFIYKFIV